MKAIADPAAAAVEGRRRRPLPRVPPPGGAAPRDRRAGGRHAQGPHLGPAAPRGRHPHRQAGATVRPPREDRVSELGSVEHTRLVEELALGTAALQVAGRDPHGTTPRAVGSRPATCSAAVPRASSSTRRGILRRSGARWRGGRTVAPACRCGCAPRGAAGPRCGPCAWRPPARRDPHTRCCTTGMVARQQNVQPARIGLASDEAAGSAMAFVVITHRHAPEDGARSRGGPVMQPWLTSPRRPPRAPGNARAPSRTRGPPAHRPRRERAGALRARPCRRAGSVRWLSCSVSPWPGKCLPQSAPGPAASATPSIATLAGSTPKLRSPMTGFARVAVHVERRSEVPVEPGGAESRRGAARPACMARPTSPL